MKLLLLICFLAFQYVECNILYGITTSFGASNTQTLLQTVIVDIKYGNFTVLTQNVVYVGSSKSTDGISTFDQKNQRFYYATNFNSDFVYAVNVTDGDLLAPISVASVGITTLDWDFGNNQLLVNAYFSATSNMLITIPFDPTLPSKRLIDLTQAGLTTIRATTIDYYNELYYVVYENQTSQITYVASFYLYNPKNITTAKLSCATGPFYPTRMFFDYKAKIIRGIGYDITAKVYNYYEYAPSTGTCTTKPIGLPSIVSATYDPTTNTLYMGHAAAAGASDLLVYDASKYVLVNTVPTAHLLSDVAISYSM